MDLDQLTEQEMDRLVEKAQAFYRKEIRPLVYPEQKGRMLVIDVESLDYEIDARLSVAIERLRNRRPGAVPLINKVGYKPTSRALRHWVPDQEC
ncbi:MAG: hypothetical protein F4X27_09065 [Chloroflexi bacterium]|nr:hypothetical protein [Chloroflexota bacterium]